MDKLVQFLRARLEDDHDTALAACYNGSGRWRQVADPYNETVEDDRGQVVVPDADGAPTQEEAAYIAWFDPARVLAEVEVKQRIVLRHSPHDMASPAHAATCEREHWGVLVCNHDGCTWPCPDLRDMASVYAKHRDYREEWRP
ncbi:DUF6221 family protein [Streptomyces sp. NPDC055722]